MDFLNLYQNRRPAFPAEIRPIFFLGFELKKVIMIPWMAIKPEGRRKKNSAENGRIARDSGPKVLKAFPASIRFRILALILLTLVPALGIMLHLAREHRNQITQDVNDNTMRLSRFMAASLERDIQAARIFLSALSQAHDSIGFDSTPCPDMIASLDIKAELFDAVGMADSTGKILCQIPRESGPARLDSLDWFRSARNTGRFSVGYDIDGTLMDKVTMNFGLPISGPDGRMHAFYFCALDLEWMNRLSERLELPDGAAVTVTDRTGRTLVRYPHPELWVGKNFPDAPLARSVQLQEEGFVESPGIDNVIRLYAFSRIRNGDLSVRVGIPRETAYAEAYAAMVRNLGALGAVSVLALLAAWAAGHWMVVNQVNRLVAATRSLAAGKLDTRTGMNHQAGEFGQLARAFDEMAESLEWREAQLRESESERSHSEDRFTEIVERAPEAILCLDGDFSLFFCNKGAESMFGWRRDELEGMELGSLEKKMEGVDTAESFPLRTALREARGERLEAFLVRRDGTTFKAEVSAARSERNSKITYTLIIRDRRS